MSLDKIGRIRRTWCEWGGAGIGRGGGDKPMDGKAGGPSGSTAVGWEERRGPSVAAQWWSDQLCLLRGSWRGITWSKECGGWDEIVDFGCYL